MTPRDETNPLFDTSGPPRYDRVRAEHGEPAIRVRVAESQAMLEKLLAAGGPVTWDGFYAPLDDAEEHLERAWSVLQNLDGTLGTDALREAHRDGQEIITEYHSRMGQDERLYRAYRELADGPASASLDATQRKILANDLRDFRLSGVHLPPAEKARCREIRAELATIGSTFADNVTDDAKDFRLVLDRPEDVEGLPATLVAAARQRAAAEDPSTAASPRWSFTLDQSSVLPFATYQRNRALRERMLRAWTTRASTPPRDNAPLVTRTLVLRKELAKLLGFDNFAELSLVPKMARSAEEVRGFLLDLADRAMPAARRETAELADVARREGGIERLERHDVAFYREVLKQRLHGFSQESLRPYFPLPRVLSGLGSVLGRLYGVTLRDVTAEGGTAGVPTTWHPDVRVLAIADGDTVLGHVLFDPYARQGKRAGAWVSGCVTRRKRPDGSIQRPVAHLVCNFPAPFGGKPSLLAHDEVRTLFHEFGHALHHVFSTVDHRPVSGIRGVPWDGVEFPSQFHENWIWDPEPLALVSGHVETGEPLPLELLGRMRAARGFFAASDLLRQVEQALIDLELHTTFDPARDDIRALIESVRNRVGVVPAPSYDRIENAFLHIFQGGYAAGYYGYKWAEVLAADAFGRFEEEGIFSQSAARDFRDHVLAPGGSVDFLDLFVRFRGRAPDPAALLRQAGIS